MVKVTISFRGVVRRRFRGFTAVFSPFLLQTLAGDRVLAGVAWNRRNVASRGERNAKQGRREKNARRETTIKHEPAGEQYASWAKERRRLTGNACDEGERSAGLKNTKKSRKSSRSQRLETGRSKIGGPRDAILSLNPVARTLRTMRIFSFILE